MSTQTENNQAAKLALTNTHFPEIDTGSIIAIGFFILYIAAGVYGAIS